MDSRRSRIRVVGGDHPRLAGRNLSLLAAFALIEQLRFIAQVDIQRELIFQLVRQLFE